MHRIRILAICGAPALLAMPTLSSAEPARERPVVMLFHGGGFVFEDPGRMEVATELAGELGFDVAYVKYPLLDLRGAIAAAESRARALGRGGREVLAYGDSAGGTLAALLAQKGLVDAAAAYSPVADMRLFTAHLEDPDGYVELVGADDRLLRRASPGLHPSREPIFVMRPIAEQHYASVAMRRWGQRDSRVEVEAVPGVHSGSLQPAFYARNVTLALRWLLHRA
jgi:acetyl esterase/lipase